MSEDYYHERDQMTVEIPKLEQRIAALDAENHSLAALADSQKREIQGLQERELSALKERNAEFDRALKAEQERDRLRADHKAEVDHWVRERDRMHSRAIKAEAEREELRDFVTRLIRQSENLGRGRGFRL